jgi:hypothetical protein
VLDRGQEGFLEGVLGNVDVAEDADEGGQDAAVLLAKYPLDSLVGRPLQERPCQRLLHLHDGADLDRAVQRAGDLGRPVDGLVQVLAIQQVKPPSCSLVSANGPSVVSVLPSRTRTVVAVELG